MRPPNEAAADHAGPGGECGQMKKRWWYRLDPDDRIVDVDEQWDTFAMENRSPEARSAHVVGKSLARFIDGEETRQLVSALLGRLRTAGGRFEIPFRCDGPAVRRHMMCAGEAEPDGAVLIRTREVSIHPRPPLMLLDPGAPRLKEWLRMCSWCNRVTVGDAPWMEAEEAIRTFGLFEEAVLPSITHGMCHDCVARIETEMDRLVAPGGADGGRGGGVPVS